MQTQDSSDPTGVASDGTRGGVLLRARERKQNAALQMKLAGATWDEIAEVVGYPTARQALVAVELALERELHTEGNQEKMRVLAGKRLERLIRAVWPKAVDPESPEQMVAVGKSRELIADFSKLWGLNAPTEIAVHAPTQAEIERWVATVAAGSAPAVEEYDIIMGELVDGMEVDDDAAQTGPGEVRVPSEDSVRDLG